MVESVRADEHEPSQDDQDMVIVGQIKGAWGLRGDLKIEVLTDNPERFSPGKALYLEGQLVQIERSRSIRGGILVKIDTVNDRTKAASLHGKIFSIPQQDIEPLPEGTYYHFQILDIAVWTEEGEYLGELKEILSTGSNDVYVVKDSDKKELLIPALEEVILDVSLADGKMTVRLLEGLR
ncbi:MAG: 16S rRNA processing protein RimM [Chloroflexi bacterium]|nr:16S rRNA processing protein RimM [Chloroflexota bacterium]